MGTRVLIDNSTLDAIFDWNNADKEHLFKLVDSHELTTYVAPETIAELLGLDATSRASRLPGLASLLLRVMNGRLFRQWQIRLRELLHGHASNQFMGALEAKQFRHYLGEIATGAPGRHSKQHRKTNRLVQKEKEADFDWRLGIQREYRNLRLEKGRNHLHPVSLEAFCSFPEVRSLVLSRIENTCADLGIPEPSKRARYLLENGHRVCPEYALHLFIELSRLWWYTVSTIEGHTVEADAFDDSLLIYVARLDLLVTPDRNLRRFFPSIHPTKAVLTPSEFLDRIRTLTTARD